MKNLLKLLKENWMDVVNFIFALLIFIVTPYETWGNALAGVWIVGLVGYYGYQWFISKS